MRNMQENYQKLEVWKKSMELVERVYPLIRKLPREETYALAMELVERVYPLIRKLPREETYALADQMRRAAVSIPSNIAEGQSRGTREFIQFLKVAKGSRAELETQLLLCARLQYLTNSDIASVLSDLEEISKMLSSLIKYLSSKAPRSNL